MRAKAMSTASAVRDFTVSFRNQEESAVAGAKDDKDKAERSFRPPSLFSASDHAAVSIIGVMPSGMGMSAGFAGTLADSIEQMARLLPIR